MVLVAEIHFLFQWSEKKVHKPSAQGIPPNCAYCYWNLIGLSQNTQEWIPSVLYFTTPTKACGGGGKAGNNVFFVAIHIQLFIFTSVHKSVSYNSFFKFMTNSSLSPYINSVNNSTYSLTPPPFQTLSVALVPRPPSFLFFGLRSS